MHADELWQVFQENGQPVTGKGAIDDAFDVDPTLLMGNAHVWFWKKEPKGVSVLLQKRSQTVKRSPGMYHISAAGHINQGETPVESAAREAKEEVGIAIDPTRLYFVLATRSIRNVKSFVYVYVYELTGDEVFSFDDNEVESVTWHTMQEFKAMTDEPSAHALINSGKSYFNVLIETIERLSK